MLHIRSIASSLILILLVNSALMIRDKSYANGLPESLSRLANTPHRITGNPLNTCTLQSPGTESEPDSPPGPFRRITLRSGSLTFVVAEAGKPFSGSIVASINDQDVPEISVEDDGFRLVLGGTPGGQSLNSYFPSGQIGIVTIINGDSTRLYLPLKRRSILGSLSIVDPKITAITPSHASPAATITISGTYFSPNARDNIIAFKASGLPEVKVRATQSTAKSLNITVPLMINQTLDDFYWGSVDVTVERYPGSGSASQGFLIDELPPNALPPGELMKQLADLLEEVISVREQEQRTRLLAQGFDPQLVEAILAVPHLALKKMRAMVDDAVAGHPQVLTIDANDDGQPENLSLDTKAIGLAERLFISSGLDSNLSSLAGRLLEKSALPAQGLPREMSTLNAALYYEDVKEDLENGVGLIVGSILSIVTCVVPPVSVVLLVFESAKIALLVALGLQHIKLANLRANHASLTLPEGESRTVIITGEFVRAIGANNLFDALVLILKKIFSSQIGGCVGLILYLAVEIANRIVGDISEELGSSIDAQFPVGGPITLNLSDYTVDVEPNGTNEISVHPVLNIGFNFTGRSQVDSQEFQANASVFPLKSRPDSDRVLMTVTVTRSFPEQPYISSITPNKLSMGTSTTVTIDGNNFALPRSGGSDGSRVEVSNSNGVLVTTIPSNAIQFYSSAEMVVPLALNNSGEFFLVVVNPDGKRSNPGQITVKDKPRINVINPTQTVLRRFILDIAGSTFDDGAFEEIFHASSGRFIRSGTILTRTTDRLQAIEDFTEAEVGEYRVRVRNSDGQVSNELSLFITPSAPGPQITNISPSEITPGVETVLRVTGDNFQPPVLATIYDSTGNSFSLSPIAASFITRTMLDVTVTVGNLGGSGGAFQLEVLNPDGQASNRFPFVVGNPPPAISVSPSNVDFGSVQVGSFLERAFTIQNIGAGTLTGVASVPIPFSIVSGSNYSLGPNQSQIVIVRFSPTTVGVFNELVTFTGGGGATRPVTGTGANPSAPTVSTGSTSNVTANSATLLGTVNPNGLSTSFYFEWGTDSFYGNRTHTQNLGSGTSASVISANISELSPNTTYHYRVVATNSAGTSRGSDASFTTADAPTSPVVVNPTSFDPRFTIGDPPATLGIQIASQSGSGMNGTISASTTSGGSWLTANGQSSYNWTAPETVSATADPTGLSAGTYSGSLTVVSPTASNSPIIIPVTMIIYEPLQITTTSLPDAVSGQPYNFQLKGGGGTGSGYIWSLQQGSNGDLPGGLSLDSQTGVISGTPSSISGSATLTVGIVLQDSIGHSVSKTFTINWREGLSIGTNFPSSFQFVVGAHYTENSTSPVGFTVSGGTPPYHWMASGMPPGLLVDSTSGLITGTPTQPGSYSVVVTVSDSTGLTANRTFTLTVVVAPLLITDSSGVTPPTLPSGTVGVAYSFFLLGIGGSQSGYEWSPVTGLPPGITTQEAPGCTISTCALLISGTPTQAGTFNFVVTLTDSLGNIAQQPLTLIINSGTPPDITTTTLDRATLGQPYSFTFTATGGAGGYTWSLVGSGPDPGLQLSPDGVLNGTSTVANDCASGPSTWYDPASSISFTVKVTDSAGQSNSNTFCLPSYYPTPQITGLTPTSIEVDGQAHTITINGANFRSDASIYMGGSVPTTYVSSNALQFHLAPRVGAAFGAEPNGSDYTEGSHTLWVGQPYSDSSNQDKTFSMFDPVPSLNDVTAFLNNSTQPCTPNLLCQLVINGSGFVSATSYLIVETNTSLNAAVYPSTPMPWNSITTGSFSVPSPGTYTIRVTNRNRPGGGMASVDAQFTVVP